MLMSRSFFLFSVLLSWKHYLTSPMDITDTLVEIFFYPGVDKLQPTGKNLTHILFLYSLQGIYTFKG